LITILGSNFPNGLADGSTVTIAFLDGTACTLVSSTSTQMQCLTSSFSTTGTLSLSITVNSQTVTSQSVTVATTTATVTSISPSSYSPVLTTTLTIILSSAYNGLWSRSDFSVNLVPQSSSLTT
jgi:IPT/TIG domain